MTFYGNGHGVCYQRESTPNHHLISCGQAFEGLPTRAKIVRIPKANPSRTNHTASVDTNIGDFFLDKTKVEL